MASIFNTTNRVPANGNFEGDFEANVELLVEQIRTELAKPKYARSKFTPEPNCMADPVEVSSPADAIEAIVKELLVQKLQQITSGTSNRRAFMK